MARYKSRATRATEVADGWRGIADKLRNASDRDEANAAIADLDTSELESLKDEMSSWRDNTEEKFGQTQKFEEVSQAVDDLENIDIEDLVGKEYEEGEFESDAETDADALESAADDLEAVSFPGMF